MIDSIPASNFRNSKVVSLLQDYKDRIWMGTYSGIVAYDPVSKGLIKLTRLNGIVNTEFNFTSACKVKEDQLVFGGLTGYDVINPKMFPISKSLPIGIITGYERIKDNITDFHDFENDQKSTIRFNSENESIRLLLGSTHTLSAYNYTYQFRYNNDSWSNLTDLPYINISKLQPGTYKIEIRAFDEYGTPITFAPVIVESTILFYKSKVFLLSLAVITVLSLATIIFLILRNQKRENEIKENISMDLHDEIGTLLARAMLVSQTKNFPDRDMHLNSYLGEALYGLRVYINTMNADKLTAQQLATEIKEMLHLSFSPLNYNFKIEEKGLEGIKLNSSKFSCIKLCFYEILNNMIRHSHGNDMQVKIHADNHTLELIIKDNGDLTNLWNFSNKGNGIKNLKKRILHQKGKLFIEIAPEGHGLLTRIYIPY